jgi:NAD(P)-dependent dehydrogenase (short-subunit alcohol dehydrogenase family)
MTLRLGLAGRCGLVTGARTEIGRACIQRLCDEGMTVAFTGYDRDLVESIAAETGATVIDCGHRDRASADRAVQRAFELGGGRLDVLVTNADLRVRGPIEATSEAQFRELLEQNLTAPFRAARASYELMRAQGAGSMIHIASDAGIRAVHQTPAYSVTSAGVIAVAELFAAEGAQYGVRSNAVCPDDLASGAASSGVGGDATAVAALAAWLACDEASDVSGATLRVDAARGAALVADTRG